MLQQVGLPVLAVDDAGMIAFVNDAAALLLQCRGLLLGEDAQSLVPELLEQTDGARVQGAAGAVSVTIDGKQFRRLMHAMGTGSRSQGRLFTLMPVDRLADAA